MRQGSTKGAGESRGRTARTTPAEGRSWLTEPRTAVLIVLGGVVLIGGGRRLRQALLARGAVARLTEPDVSPREVEGVDRFGRAGLHDLFRLFSDAPSAAIREAAGRAIASLWGQDQLIAEEEQALVRRGYAVQWHARRRYPRALKAEIPVEVTYGLPFLADDGPGVRPSNLEWSHRVTGARRAALEEFSPWSPGNGRAAFTIIPGDFESSGPHKLVLQARVRTAGLTDSWQIDLPHIPFPFEFDPRLEVSSLLASPDDARGEVIGRSLRLEASGESDTGPSRFLPLGDEMTLRSPPRVVVSSPLPCDLAHTVAVEFEGVPGQFDAGKLVLSGQGGRADRQEGSERSAQSFDLGPIGHVPREALSHPGRRAMRAILTAGAELGWTDPEVRSVWPGTIETGWVEVEIVRR
jgi:hypothetical protein